MYTVRTHGCYSHCRSRGRFYRIRDVLGRFREEARQQKDSLILSTTPRGIAHGYFPSPALQVCPVVGCRLS
jgi:hypothetical protein